MQSFFSAEFFSGNRKRLQEKLGHDTLIVLTANGTMQRGGDEPLSFYQDSSFWYLTGLDGADLTLVISAEDTYVIVPGLSAVREAFDGAHDTAAYAKRSGISRFMAEQEGWQRLRSQIQAVDSVATLLSPPEFIKSHGIYSLPYRRRLIARLKRMHSGLAIRDIRPELAVMRSIKQPEELLALQKAIDITAATLQDIAKHTLPEAAHEYELDAALAYGFRRRGATGHAFSPIVGAGSHSTTLHYMNNDGPLGPDDLVVLDVGAEFEHYAADITRTVSQTPITERKAELFRAVAIVQDYALGLIKPGVLPRDYELAVEERMGKELRKLKLITTPTRENIRRYFPHATSHFLGLDTHDTGDYRAPWQENMVITCEPGIYIPEEGIGVRIEDDVLITQNGNRVLSQDCPRELTAVQ